MMTMVVISCVLSILPAALFLRNLSLYRRLSERKAMGAGCSVLIPARDEEYNIAAALHSVLRSEDVDLEVIVLDDSSTDRTAEIVREFAAADSRVRLETAGFLPAGWCGKNFACHQLAQLARHPLLIFMDADVRVSRSDSLARLGQFVEESGAALISGVPRQETEGLMEKLIVPLIQFVLLGFLSLDRMRHSTDPKFSAACGQIIAVKRDAYEDIGGHAGIAGTLHDGLRLARLFRSRGHATDLFDATDTFSCRMYRRAGEVWNGFAKNAREGLGSRQLILPATILLLNGQVLPFALLAAATSRVPMVLAAIAVFAALLPRLISVIRFRQSLLGAVLHPVGVSLLVAIQWFAFAVGHRRNSTAWKGRVYSPVGVT